MVLIVCHFIFSTVGIHLVANLIQHQVITGSGFRTESFSHLFFQIFWLESEPKTVGLSWVLAVVLHP